MSQNRFFKLTIAYDGSDFAGWQIQPNRPTIQASLQQAFADLGCADVHVVGSGRTDAGVHALGQIASCQVAWRDSPDRLASALNTKLPDAIVVEQVSEAADGFHAIRDAVGKRYRYQLQAGGRRDVFQHRYHWRVPYRLDVESMRQGARALVGRHDFKAFQATGSERKTTVRHVRDCDVFLQEPGRHDRMRLALEIEADGFLYNMVRNIVGTLVEIGRGRQTPGWIEELIQAGNRDLAGQTAPPQGLFLVRVDYR